MFDPVAVKGPKFDLDFRKGYDVTRPLEEFMEPEEPDIRYWDLNLATENNVSFPMFP